jgi:hypothetical protein
LRTQEGERGSRRWQDEGEKGGRRKKFGKMRKEKRRQWSPSVLLLISNISSLVLVQTCFIFEFQARAPPATNAGKLTSNGDT